MAMKILEPSHNTPHFDNTSTGSIASWSSPPGAAPKVATPTMVDQAVGTDVPELVDESIGTEDLPEAIPSLLNNNHKKEKTLPPVNVADACVGTEEPWQAPTAVATANKPPKQVATADACVGTDGEFKVESTSAVADSTAAASTSAAAVTASAPPKATAVPTEDKPTHDLLSLLIYLFFSSAFRLIWFFLIRIPFLFFKYTTIVLFMWGLLTLAWLYFADNSGAEAMGAIPLPFYNHYGIV